ncbi:uncharacterized protein LOC118267730 [Spodoptera frugiperda]|uniref:Uncharacterized protein LOC118267730 n=1 Tax=Spodoptera frugiperda TaxID=7108 RepID=A0A9R0D2F8_SPOFR|nr:uncharacterized protein LOC118267730 [Spodoptera frugiperda]
MMFERLVLLFLLFICCLYSFNCLIVIPERVLVRDVNENYLKYVTATVRRISKRGEYVVNVDVYTKIVLANNVSMQINLYEYNSKYNQYVLTPMMFNYKWCELVLHDQWFGSLLRRNGLTVCPTPVGRIVLPNMTLSGSFPFKVPFKRGKFDTIWKLEATNEVIGCIDTFVTLLK